MHNLCPAPRIRDPLQLIPPAPDDQGRDNPEGLFGRRDERSDRQQRILLVEDEFLLSMVLAEDLQAAGYEVVGPCATVEGAMDAVQSELFEGAILDINLRGELIYPVAEELLRRRIPFLFLTGYSHSNIPERFRAHPRLAKPAASTAILREVDNILRVNRLT